MGQHVGGKADIELTLDALLDDAHPVKRAAAAWAEEHLTGAPHGFDASRWRAAAAAGVQGVISEERFGGRARSAIEAMLLFEGLALGADDAGFVFALASQTFAMQRPLARFGTDAQRERWLRPLCTGDAVGAFAMSEPLAGSDTSAITTTATPLGDGRHRLHGTKSWVTLGPVCDVVVVFATTDPAKGRWGITAFLVPTDRDGVTRGPVEAKMGLHGCPFGQLRFDGCIVGEDEVLGAPGAGANVFTDAVEAERAFLYAAQLGAMERALQVSIRRARERVQFSQPIGSFQAISHRIVEMKLRLETARLMVYKAAALHDRGEPVALAASLAKLQTSEAAVASALDAIRIFGAEGYTEAAGVEVFLRDAVGGLAYSGTSDIQRNIAARLLGVDRPSRPTGRANLTEARV